MARVGQAAVYAKDTVIDASVKATPILQKAASVAGQVLSVAGAIAQPIVHHLAQGVAEVTAPKHQRDSLKEEIAENVKEVPLATDLKHKMEGQPEGVSKDKVELTGSFRTKPFQPSTAPVSLTAGNFMSTDEAKLREAQAPDTIKSNTTNTFGDIPAPLAAQSQFGASTTNQQLDKSKYNQSGSTDQFSKDSTREYDSQLKLKLNTNQQRQQQQQHQVL
jgi:hypothetical protein